MTSMLEIFQFTLRHRFVASVVVPTVFVAFYLAFIASPGYVGRADIVVEREGGGGFPGYDLGLLSLGTETSKLDALIVEHYMKSRAMLEAVDAQLDLRAHYQDASIDAWQRLKADAQIEELHEFFVDRLETLVDEEAYILSIEFVAHDPRFAQRVVEVLVQESEAFVNEVSRKRAREQMAFIKGEVDASYERLREASLALLDVQRDNDVLNPEQETVAAGKIIGGLSQELTKQRTRQRALAAFLNPDAPELLTLSQQIKALEEQMAAERNRLVGAESGGITEAWMRFQEADLNVKLASEVYKSALASLEKTRLDAARKVKFLVSLSGSYLPEEAGRPRTLYWTTTVFLMLSLAYFVVGLVIATIRDHRE